MTKMDAASAPGLKGPLQFCPTEGMAQDEAAALLDISRKAAETRIYQARRKLSKLLEGLARRLRSSFR
ncbi:hypothetical protein GCM10011494_09050 [Novosphingobium endophyticum]|uniref:RNA polymerase sigma factor 70 region 4 type 2 domain-containing protein n=1 Tax=Novosphingobium endophyticum TaxID=1955250 RepID=A0A916TQD1_9SPHN|nr:hypothetical protein GCM10011494_09050 [Novosphingobium endophyticum]